MKRSSDFKNSQVDGSTLKKIKKLSFMLQNDEEENDEINHSKLIRNNLKPVINKIDSDSESEDDEEEEIVYDEEVEELNEEERAVLEKYNTAKIAEDVVHGMEEAREEVASNLAFGEDEEEFNLEDNASLIEHFEQLRTLLKKHKRSKVFPKTVKVLPQTENWNQVLEQLDFPSWSPAAVKAMADQFRAKGGEDATMFYGYYLLPYVKENIAQNKRLDNVLFQALKDALYRRREFMKGILYPWCMGDIDGKEAEVLSNVIRNVTVKADAGTSAMLRLSKQPYSKGRLSVIQSLLEKKYTAPSLLIDSLVDMFHQSTGQLPLSWFQCLCLFVSLYYQQMSVEQLKKVSDTCKMHRHEKVTPAIQAYLKMSNTKKH